MKVGTKEQRQITFCRVVEHITACNPSPNRRHDEIRLLFPLKRLRILLIFFTSLINNFQRHRNCKEGVCLRHNKKTNDVRCRYYFPRRLLEAGVDIDGKSWKFA